MKQDFNELVRLMRRLRGKGGCAWDREQKISSFTTHLKNESDEVLKAIRKKDYENLKEELGDLLWNIIFISQIAREEGLFDIHDVMAEIREKIIRRHLHVFREVKLETAGEVLRYYRKIKRQEKYKIKRKKQQGRENGL